MDTINSHPTSRYCHIVVLKIPQINAVCCYYMSTKFISCSGMIILLRCNHFNRLPISTTILHPMKYVVPNQAPAHVQNLCAISLQEKCKNSLKVLLVEFKCYPLHSCCDTTHYHHCTKCTTRNASKALSLLAIIFKLCSTLLCFQYTQEPLNQPLIALILTISGNLERWLCRDSISWINYASWSTINVMQMIKVVVHQTWSVVEIDHKLSLMWLYTPWSN